ncbi:hypothetical protein OBBRIDRAFT_756696 [Obba rivulosa]|uniref:Signal peptidase complex subunit 2 n=1 Tax=Obba rivulosa TaxID=1052685 RepID=A0A8E2AQY8_9APHY|nr:hypothetical protein OBBRIDRAFT_756696 [Obba rivulosa]
MAPKSRKAANGSANPSGSTSGEKSPSKQAQVEGETAVLVDAATTHPGLNLAPSAMAREEVKVNNASATDMKHACDDALKRFLSRPELFKQIHTHTDVRLALGWASVLVSAGTGFYGYKVEFEKSKPVIWAGLILYILLTVAQALYAYFVEGDVVFVGKRKTFDKRIVTERITVSSKTIPSTPSAPCPSYALSLSYVRSASGGKTLLGKGRAGAERPHNAFFDAQGVMDQEGFERWVGGIVGRVMQGPSE